MVIHVVEKKKQKKWWVNLGRTVVLERRKVVAETLNTGVRAGLIEKVNLSNTWEVEETAKRLLNTVQIEILIGGTPLGNSQKTKVSMHLEFKDIR